MVPDTAIRKMMTVEYVHYMKATITMDLFANDLTACFDRMWLEITNIIARASGCDDNTLKGRYSTKAAMHWHIKTGVKTGLSEYPRGTTLTMKRKQSLSR